MQNKNFLYRLVPRKSKLKQTTTAKQSNDQVLGVKPVNFFENCYIFSEPAVISRSYSKQKEKQIAYNKLKKSRINIKVGISPQSESNNQVHSHAKYNKISLQLSVYPSNLFAIHSRKKPLPVNGLSHEKEAKKVESVEARLEINAFNRQKLAKRASFIKRDIHTERQDRKTTNSKVQKILSLYPTQNKVIDKNLSFCTKRRATIDVGLQRKEGKVYRPWSPQRLARSSLIEITQQMQEFLQIPQ